MLQQRYLVFIVYRMYIITFMLYLLILPKRYAHGMFAAGRAFVPTQGKKKDLGS